MNRTYTYAELKDLINEELVNFNFIIESKHIFNSEFKKYRKFFKGLTKKTSYVKDSEYNRELQKYVPIKRPIHPCFNTYEDTKGFGLYFSLTKESVVDLDMNQLYIDFPNLKADQEKLLSLKEKVRSGRRPKDLEKDYEAERLRKAQEEDKATCGICNDYWELVDIRDQKNIIHDHGFNIQWGYRNNVCFGARYKCWEKSPESKKEYVKRVLKPLLEKVILDKPNELTLERLKEHNAKRLIATKELNNLSDGVYREWYKHKNRKDYLRFIESEYCPENVKIVHNLKLLSARPTIRFVGQQFATKLYDKELVLSYLLHLWITYKQQLESEIARFETAIKNWKLQPTPRERLGK